MTNTAGEDHRTQLSELGRRGCECCGKPLVARRWPCGVTENARRFALRKYCDLKCAGRAHAMKPSAAKSSSRTHQIARGVKPLAPCERCGGEGVEVHHKDRNHTNNELTNLERVCVECHHAEHRRLKPSCTICGKPQNARGYCKRHYMRLWRYGNPLAGLA